VAPPAAPAVAPATNGLVTAGDLAGRFGAGVNGCTLTPQTIAGPSYLEVDALRTDLRDDRQGVPLGVGLRVLDPGCAPVAGAAVELWSCDALGLYSGYPQREGDTTGLTFGRGTQVTDANGIVAFTTVYPGWYRTRAPHLHAKVLLSSTAVLTTQLFLDDAVSATVFTSAPYATHTGQDTFNGTDSMFVPGTVLTLSPEPTTGGWLGLLDLTVRPA
jgi:protocatechuate 3,4-dioxygenase beta subunit